MRPLASIVGSTLLGGNTEVAGMDDKLLQKARAMRMNTDVRKAVFCVIMSSEVCFETVYKYVIGFRLLEFVMPISLSFVHDLVIH